MHELALLLDRQDKRTLTEQLYAYVQSEIMRGAIAPKEKLPSKRELSRHLSCSINTIENAYNQLVDEGYLVPREKSGYYAAELDGILDLGQRQKETNVIAGPTDMYRYDFSYHGVDLDHFPFRQWRTITREVIHEGDRDLFCMGDPKGFIGLRSSIARYIHQSRGVECSPARIIISSGTEYLLQLLIQLLDESVRYAIENPGYERISQLFKSNRVDFTPMDLDDQGVRPDDLEHKMVDVVCITPSHQFPTGCIMPVARRLQLLGWAAARPGRYIIEDDYDSEFRYSGKPIPSLQGMDRSDRVIYVGSFSKSLSPALRISYMVLPEHLVPAFDERLHFLNCAVPMIDQKILAQFIDKGHFERHLNRMRNLYRQKREVLVSALRSQLPRCRIEGAFAGLHMTVRIDNGMDEQELVRSAQQQRVRVYGLSRYYAELAEGKLDGRLLLGFATMRIEEMPKAVELLRKAWD